MFWKPKRREENRFFQLFTGCAQQSVLAAEALLALLQNPVDAPLIADKIHVLEHSADLLTHETVALLHKTFLTPIDREDIHQLISKLDDVVDCIDAAAGRARLYKIPHFDEDAISLGRVVLSATQDLLKAIEELPNMKHSNSILRYCVEVNRLENEGDKILRRALEKLFSSDMDCKDLIKVKEVLEILEIVTDRCEDVANTLESIVLEYS
jgi:uncharacterized protein